MRVAPAEVPATKALEVEERRRAAMTVPRPPRLFQQVEVMAHEPHRPVAQEAFEEIGADLVVRPPIDGLADVVEEGGGPEHAILGGAPGELEDLERMVEGVALGMVAGRLLDAVQSFEERKEIIFHGPAGRFAAA